MNDPRVIRKQVRATLCTLRDGERASEQFIIAALNQFFPSPVQVPELKAALAWNEERGFIDSRYNADFEQTEFIITKAGRAKEDL